jgi:hypothetical protein
MVCRCAVLTVDAEHAGDPQEGAVESHHGIGLAEGTEHHVAHRHILNRLL